MLADDQLFLNQQVFYWLFDLSHRWPVLDAISIFFAQYAIFILGGIAAVIALRSRSFVSLVLSAVAAYGLNALIGAFVYRDRPFVVYDIVPLLEHSATKSFPSDHTGVSFAIATALTVLDRRHALWAYPLAFLIGLGRVFAGIHFPADVLAGIVTGIGSALLVCAVIARLRLRGVRI